jgi:aryl-phospho-beta-D-glucosidase BglC (GH1 family)
VALWQRADYRQRFIALWREIASRYTNEPVIAGYDLLNEPVVAGPRSGWEALAKATVAELRTVDTRHIVFVERTNAIMDIHLVPDWTENRNGEMNFFLVNDTNVVYEFHFYKPMQFTHQRADWIGGLRDLRTTYPGPFKDWDGTRRTADRDYLQAELAPYVRFANRHQVPIFLGELGVIRFGFEPGRNGLGWASDMIDLASSNNMGFAWHCYHEIPFGLFANDAASPPAELNQALAELFARKLGSRKLK